MESSKLDEQLSTGNAEENRRIRTSAWIAKLRLSRASFRGKHVAGHLCRDLPLPDGSLCCRSLHAAGLGSLGILSPAGRAESLCLAPWAAPVVALVVTVFMIVGFFFSAGIEP